VVVGEKFVPLWKKFFLPFFFTNDALSPQSAKRSEGATPAFSSTSWSDRRELFQIGTQLNPAMSSWFSVS